jgi:choline kinase
MRAIILAAGRGSRMGQLTAAVPKCLVQLGGKPLIEWQIGALRAAGIGRIGIVTGWQPEQLVTRGFETFHNARWSETQMVMSLACASEWLATDTCIVSYSDIFYPASAVRALMDAPGDIAITYDPDWLALWSRRFAEPLSDAESFETDAAHFVSDIGRRTDDVRKIRGQYMGLLKFTRQGWQAARALLAALDRQEQDRLDMTSLLQRLVVARQRVRAVAVSGPWGEIDNEHDLALYSEDFAKGKLDGLCSPP